MIVRISIVGEELKTGVCVYPLCASPRHPAAERIRGNHTWIRVAERTADLHWVRRSGILRLQSIACLAQVRTLGADIAYLQHPLPPQCSLHRQIPLLGIGHDVMPRNLQAENVAGEERPRASSAGGRTIVRGLGGVTSRETLENREARNECRVECAGLREGGGGGVRATRQ